MSVCLSRCSLLSDSQLLTEKAVLIEKCMSPKNKSQGGVFQFLKWILLVAFREQGNCKEKKHSWHVFITVSKLVEFKICINNAGRGTLTCNIRVRLCIYMYLDKNVHKLAITLIIC